jgi:hypothetical protein
MKTCKGFWGDQALIETIVFSPAGNKISIAIRESNLFDAVPLSEFEAYKNKVKKTLEEARNKMPSLHDKAIVNQVIGFVKAGLELK